MRRPASLSSRRDFRRTRGEGARGTAGGLTVFVARRSSAEAPSRLGLSVGSGVGTAVERNRIRRRLRAAFAVAVPRGYDVVIRASGGVGRQEFQDLVEDVRMAVSRAVTR